MLPWAFFCLLFMSWAAPAQNVTVQISGRVTDAGGGAISDAQVRLLSHPLRREVAKAGTDRLGTFTLTAPASSDYLLSVWSHGFRAQQKVVLLSGATRQELGTLSLSLLSCEAPDILCDTFGIGSVGPSPSKRGTLAVPLHCGVDLDQGRTFCPDTGQPSSTVDLWFVSDREAALYLEPAHNAGFTVNPLPTSHCRLPSYGHERFQITELGPGIEFCVSTVKGRNAYLYLPETVRAGSQSIKLYYALYKRKRR